MNLLQRSLSINALVSGLSGLAMILLHHPLAQLFGLQSGTVFWILGIGLLIFSATVALEVRRQRAFQVLTIIVQDELWVLGSLLILIWQPWPFSPAGNLLTAGMALLVLAFAVGQGIGLARMDRMAGSRSKRLTFGRKVKAPAREVWELISQVDRYAEFAPNLDHSGLVSGEREGAERVCRQGKNSWSETCTAWDEGKSYTFRVHTEAPGYPFPFASLAGHWAVKPLPKNETEIEMDFEFRFKKPWQDLLLYPLMRAKFIRTAEQLLDNWQKALEGGVK